MNLLQNSQAKIPSVRKFGDSMIPQQFGSRWSVVLSDEDVKECKDRATKWLEYKQNQSNLFEGSLVHKLAGLKGEVALLRLLDYFKVPRDYGGGDDGADEFDFRINGKIYSLKTQRTISGLSNGDQIRLHQPQAAHRADFYIFAYNLSDGPEVIFMGEISKENFLKNAKAIKKGEFVCNAMRFASNRVGWECKADMYVRTVACLKPLSFLEQFPEKSNRA
jgi:hypothetical protein